ncbi:MAG: sulfurtransferase, partial [Gemmatimonadales bacterium]|nr:sulfurtransferase [Gemmatimonadales bacterium]
MTRLTPRCEPVRGDLPLSSIVSTEWLARRLGDARVCPVDASWYLPSAGRDAAAEYLAGHIPGAVRFDLDVASDPSSPLPHMLPGAEAFGAYVGEIGLGDTDAIVVYDGSGVNLSAARAWWMFRAFGHRRTAVLDGGMVKWRAERRPLDGGAFSLPPA